MSAIQNIVEYYDELFPVSASKKKFYEKLIKEYVPPVKFLSINCGTGMFETFLAKAGNDVTGLEECPELVRSASMRRRNQLMSVRLFEMSYRDMTKFLGKGFYNVISCLDDRIIYIHEESLLLQFFKDCRSLLSPEGTLVLSLPNFSKYQKVPMTELPTRESIRVRLFSELWQSGQGKSFMVQNLETGNGRMIPVRKDIPIYTLMPEEILNFARDTGFSSVKFYSDFDESDFTGNEDCIVVKIR